MLGKEKLITVVLALATLAAGQLPSADARVRGMFARASVQSGSQQYSLVYQGLTRTYRVYTPTTLIRSKPAALVFVFHGAGGNSIQAENTYGMDSVADKYGFIAVYPQGVNNKWNTGEPNGNPGIDDVGFAGAMIDALSLQFNINSRAVFACGISDGALLSNYLALQSSNQYCAIGSVAGDIPTPDVGIKPSSPVAVMLIHGTNDQYVPFNGGSITGSQGTATVLSHAQTLAAWESYDGGVTAVLANYVIASVSGSQLGATHSNINTPTQVTDIQTSSQKQCISVVVTNGGHTWPGHPATILHGLDGVTAMNFDASEMLGRFFMSMVGN